ncbi:Acyltransferase [Flaviramulus basaltis]|uniref:Acyltransferase n=1 Tax=Flaviramulus basaltis TaxID=369401 RepID=A0A1K2IKF3_9FLAO|nr:Acyltransferase [Flaviramulus basaltis]
MYLANHQNALLDALLIAVYSQRFSYFLTRAGVFKSGFVSKLLNSLQMLPVYRIRDGWNNLSNNTAIFNTCADLFNKKEAVVIFPEGNHNLKRNVRSLSKGFTRIIFETFEKYPNIDLQLIPVGLNFINAEKFPDSASLYFGKPLNAKDFVLENKNEAAIVLRERIQLEISKLTTHIPSEGYDETLHKLNSLNVDFLNPTSVNKTIAGNFKNYPSVKSNTFSAFKPFFKSLLIILLIAPYLVWKFMVQPKIKEIEFVSTFRFVMAITLVPIWILIIALALGFNLDWPMSLAYVFLVLCLALITVKA